MFELTSMLYQATRGPLGKKGICVSAGLTLRLAEATCLQTTTALSRRRRRLKSRFVGAILGDLQQHALLLLFSHVIRHQRSRQVSSRWPTPISNIASSQSSRDVGYERRRSRDILHYLNEDVRQTSHLHSDLHATGPAEAILDRRIEFLLTLHVDSFKHP